MTLLIPCLYNIKDRFCSGVPTSLPSTCLSSASSCACLVAALQSTDCFLHDASDDDIKSQKILNEQHGGGPVHSEATHRMFKIYFVLSTFLLGIGLAGYCILRLIQACQIFFNNLNDYLLHKLPLSRLAVPVEERRQRRVRPDCQTQTVSRSLKKKKSGN